MKNLRIPTLLRKISSAPALAIMAFIVYLMTLASGVFGYDSAELASGVYCWGIVHPPGFPLYMLIGKLFTFLPFGNIAYRLNLMSAFFASLTIFFLHLVIEGLTGRRIYAWLGAGLFAFSNYFWQMALVAEVYSLSTFFMALNLFLVLRWHLTGSYRYLLLFALFYGISMGNHTSGLFFAPGFAWLVASAPAWTWRKWKRLVPMLALFLLGLSTYLYLPLRALADPPLNYVKDIYHIDLTTLEGVYWMISSQTYRFFSFAYPINEIPEQIGLFFQYLWRNFLGIGVVFGIPGLYVFWHRRVRWLIGIVLTALPHTIFYINYHVMDKDTMFLPVYLVWTLFAAFGFQGFIDLINRQVDNGTLHKIFKTVFSTVLISFIFITVLSNWRWVDMSQANGPALFAHEVLKNVDENAVLISSWSPAVVLEYFQIVEGERPDITIFNRSRHEVAWFYQYWKQGIPRSTTLEMIDRQLLDYAIQKISEGPVYLVNYDSLYADNFNLTADGDIFRLDLLPEPSSP